METMLEINHRSGLSTFQSQNSVRNTKAVGISNGETQMELALLMLLLALQFSTWAMQSVNLVDWSHFKPIITRESLAQLYHWNLSRRFPQNPPRSWRTLRNRRWSSSHSPSPTVAGKPGLLFVQSKWYWKCTSRLHPKGIRNLEAVFVRFPVSIMVIWSLIPMRRLKASGPCHCVGSMRKLQPQPWINSLSTW